MAVAAAAFVVAACFEAALPVSVAACVVVGAGSLGSMQWVVLNTRDWKT